MQSPYKIEVFDRDISFRDFSVIEQPSINFDYLTLEPSKINIPKGLKVRKGDYVHITNSLGAVIYQGIVSDIGIKRNIADISVVPLLSLFDLTVSYDRRDLQQGALENFIAGIITGTFITSGDVLQRIPGLTVAVESFTTGTKLNIKSNVHEFYDIITKAFTMYGIVMNIVLLPGSKSLSVTIGRAILESITVETMLENVLDKNFVIGDGYGQINKMTLINKNNEAQVVTYYLHTDGTVSADNTDRIVPVFSATEYVESEDFETDARNRASETLSPQRYDNLIEVTFRTNDTLVNLDQFAIGAVVDILDEESYSSVLTGYEWSIGKMKYIFGNIRVDLTKKLILERRSV